MQSSPIVYPAGALVRVAQICRDPKTGAPGLLPISRPTWYRWLAAGRAPAGRKIGQNVTVWSIEAVLALGAEAAGEDVVAARSNELRSIGKTAGALA